MINQQERMQNLTQFDLGFLTLSSIQRIGFTALGSFILVSSIFIYASLSMSKRMDKRLGILSQNLMVSNLVLGLGLLTKAVHSYAGFTINPTTCTFAKIYRKCIILSGTCIFIATLLALDRSMTIFFPRVYMKFSGKRRVVPISTTSWIIALTLAISSSFQNSNNCLWIQNHVYDNEIVPICVLTCVTVISLIYISLFKRVRKFQREVPTRTGPFIHRITQILFLSTTKISVIVLTTLILYVPISIVSVVVMLYPSSFDHMHDLRVAFEVVFAFTSMINPLIYTFVLQECPCNMIKRHCFWNQKRVERTEMELKFIIAPYLKADIASRDPTQPRGSHS